MSGEVFPFFAILWKSIIWDWCSFFLKFCWIQKPSKSGACFVRQFLIIDSIFFFLPGIGLLRFSISSYLGKSQTLVLLNPISTGPEKTGGGREGHLGWLPALAWCCLQKKYQSDTQKELKSNSNLYASWSENAKAERVFIFPHAVQLPAALPLFHPP